MSERTKTAVSADQQWFAELTWTDSPEKLRWFVHPYDPKGEYDNLTVSWDCDDTGQTVEDVLQSWMEFWAEGCLEARS